MATLKCIAIPGMKLWFPSNDHEPPHFHVKRSGAWEYRVFFLEDARNMFEVKWKDTPNTEMSRQDKRQIAALVETNRRAILEEWEVADQ